MACRASASLGMTASGCMACRASGCMACRGSVYVEVFSIRIGGTYASTKHTAIKGEGWLALTLTAYASPKPSSQHRDPDCLLLTLQAVGLMNILPTTPITEHVIIGSST